MVTLPPEVLSEIKIPAILADTKYVFICPKCNVEVVDPDIVRVRPPWWSRNRVTRSVPVCPAGHKLRGIIGSTSELSLPLACLFGLWKGFILLLLGFFEDLRFVRSQWPHADLTLIAAVLFLLGIVSLSRAWNWAGRGGPVHRLTSRACGMAIGYLVTATVACHSIYFHWVNLLEAACRK